MVFTVPGCVRATGQTVNELLAVIIKEVVAGHIPGAEAYANFGYGNIRRLSIQRENYLPDNWRMNYNRDLIDFLNELNDIWVLKIIFQKFR